MRLTVVLGLLLFGFTAPASADAIGDEVDYPDCPSGRAFHADHDSYLCIEPPTPPERSGCAVGSAPGRSDAGWLGAVAVALLRRRRAGTAPSSARRPSDAG